MTHFTRQLSIALIAGMAAATGAQGAVVFDADFESATPAEATPATFVSLFDSGTDIGNWTDLTPTLGYSGSDGPRITSDGAGNNGAIAGFNDMGWQRAMELTSTVSLADGVSVSMDVATLKGQTDDFNRNTHVVGLDSSGQEVFRILIEGVNSADKLTYLPMGESDEDNAVYIGDIVRNNNAGLYDPNAMTNFLLELSSSSFDIFYDGGALPTVSNVSYRTLGVSNLDRIIVESVDDGRAHAWLDNILVETSEEGPPAIPAPAALPAGLALLVVAAMKRRAHRA